MSRGGGWRVGRRPHLIKTSNGPGQNGAYAQESTKPVRRRRQMGGSRGRKPRYQSGLRVRGAAPENLGARAKKEKGYATIDGLSNGGGSCPQLAPTTRAGTFAPGEPELSEGGPAQKDGLLGTSLKAGGPDVGDCVACAPPNGGARCARADSATVRLAREQAREEEEAGRGTELRSASDHRKPDRTQGRLPQAGPPKENGHVGSSQ